MGNAAHFGGVCSGDSDAGAFNVKCLPPGWRCRFTLRLIIRVESECWSFPGLDPSLALTRHVAAHLRVARCPVAVLPPALNMSVFLLIGKTSALTMNVAGVIKDWLLIILSVLLYG